MVSRSTRSRIRNPYAKSKPSKAEIAAVQLAIERRDALKPGTTGYELANMDIKRLMGSPGSGYKVTSSPTTAEGKTELDLIRERNIRDEEYAKFEASRQAAIEKQPIYAEDWTKGQPQSRALTPAEQKSFQVSVMPRGEIRSQAPIFGGVTYKRDIPKQLSETGRRKTEFIGSARPVFEPVTRPTMSPMAEEQKRESRFSRIIGDTSEEPISSYFRGMAQAPFAGASNVLEASEKLPRVYPKEFEGMFQLPDIKGTLRPYGGRNKDVQTFALGSSIIGATAVFPSLGFPLAAGFTIPEAKRFAQKPTVIGGERVVLSALPLLSFKLPTSSSVKYGTLETTFIKPEKLDLSYSFLSEPKEIFVPVNRVQKGGYVTLFRDTQYFPVRKQQPGFDVPILLGERISGKQVLLPREEFGLLPKGTLKSQRQTQIYGKEYDPFRQFETKINPFEMDMFQKTKLQIIAGEQTTLSEFGIKRPIAKGYEPLLAGIRPLETKPVSGIQTVFNPNFKGSSKIDFGIVRPQTSRISNILEKMPELPGIKGRRGQASLFGRTELFRERIYRKPSRFEIFREEPSFRESIKGITKGRTIPALYIGQLGKQRLGTNLRTEQTTSQIQIPKIKLDLSQIQIPRMRQNTIARTKQKVSTEQILGTRTRQRTILKSVSIPKTSRTVVSQRFEFKTPRQEKIKSYRFYLPKSKSTKKSMSDIKIGSINRKYMYTPSLTAELLNIRATKINMRYARTGLAIRPIQSR